MGSQLRQPLFFLIAVATVAFGMLAFASTAFAGVLHNVDGWAWSGSTGWISMNCEDVKPGYPTGDCDVTNENYGLDIDDNGNLSGWAWSERAGWICFGSECDGAPGVPVAGTPIEDHFCPSNVPCAIYDPGDGQMHGWAYVVGASDVGAGLFRGWISLNCTDTDPNTQSPHSCTSDFGVEFDEGVTGSDAQFSGYAWNGNVDNTGQGWIEWACAATRPCAGLDWGVTSTWINSGWTTMEQQEGIYHPDIAGAQTELTDIPLVFHDFSAPQDAILRCVILTSNGTRKDLQWTITQRLVQEPNFSPDVYTVLETDPLTDVSGNPVVWSFSTAPPEDPFGCEIQAQPPIKKTVDNLIAVHPIDWTFTGPSGVSSSDSNRAKFCLDDNLGDGNPNFGYFSNQVQCDTEGDLAMSLLKAKGLNIEVRCRDNLDDDTSGQKDCDGGTLPTLEPDRNCRGITYMCITHPPIGLGGNPLP